MVSILGHRWCAVALDEAHEMCINKDLKAEVAHPTKQKKTLFFNYRIKSYKNIVKELFPKRINRPPSNAILTQTCQNEENIKQMRSLTGPVLEVIIY